MRFKQLMVFLMVAAHTIFFCYPDRMDEVVRHWSVMTLSAKADKTLMQAHILVKRETGKCVVVAFWQSLEAAQAFGETEAFRQFCNEIAPMLREPVQREIFEVAAYWN